MTGIYDWNQMPHVVAIRCPRCNSEAKFEFAELVKLKRKEDVSFFQNSDVFEYRYFESTGSGRWHAAIYYHGLNSSSTSNINSLPDGHHPEGWQHSPYLYRPHGSDIGTIICSYSDRGRNSCSRRNKSIEDRIKILLAVDLSKCVLVMFFFENHILPERTV